MKARLRILPISAALISLTCPYCQKWTFNRQYQEEFPRCQGSLLCCGSVPHDEGNRVRSSGWHAECRQTLQTHSGTFSVGQVHVRRRFPDSIGAFFRNLSEMSAVGSGISRGVHRLYGSYVLLVSLSLSLVIRFPMTSSSNPMTLMASLICSLEYLSIIHFFNQCKRRESNPHAVEGYRYISVLSAFRLSAFPEASVSQASLAPIVFPMRHWRFQGTPLSIMSVFPDCQRRGFLFCVFPQRHTGMYFIVLAEK